jgi:hypothetical protein
MYVLLFFILAVICSTQRLYAPFPSSTGKLTCNDQTCRKDLYAGKYVNCVGTPSKESVASKQICFDRCNAEPNCAAFTYYAGGPCNLFITTSSKCPTKEGGAAGSFNGVFTPISINAQRTCNDQTCRKDLFAGQWVNCNNGATFASVPNVGTETDCATQCLKETGCYYFTYYPGGICNLFVTNGATCTEGYSGAVGSWYRFGSSSNVSPMEGEETVLHETSVEEKEENDPHESVITGLAAGLGVAGFLVLALSGIIVFLLGKWGKIAASEKSVQLL